MRLSGHGQKPAGVGCVSVNLAQNGVQVFERNIVRLRSSNELEIVVCRAVAVCRPARVEQDRLNFHRKLFERVARHIFSDLFQRCSFAAEFVDLGNRVFFAGIGNDLIVGRIHFSRKLLFCQRQPAFHDRDVRVVVLDSFGVRQVLLRLVQHFVLDAPVRQIQVGNGVFRLNCRNSRRINVLHIIANDQSLFFWNVHGTAVDALDDVISTFQANCSFQNVVVCFEQILGLRSALSNRRSVHRRLPHGGYRQQRG